MQRNETMTITSKYRQEDVRVYYKQSTLFLRGAGWETNVTRKPVYKRINGHRWRFDFTVRTLTNMGFDKLHGIPSTTTWPHGILGQTWDNDAIAVDGARDDYTGEDNEMRTTSMANGALEGEDSDLYVVTPQNFDFKFSRFTDNHMGPRDATVLKGVKHVADNLSLQSVGYDD